MVLIILSNTIKFYLCLIYRSNISFIKLNISRNLIFFLSNVFTVTKQNGEEGGNASNSTEVVEKGEVEATKEGEKEKNKDKESKDENTSEGEKDKDKESGNEQEVVFIQDMGFTVKIVSPGAEPFDIQVSSMELVQVNIFISNK